MKKGWIILVVVVLLLTTQVVYALNFLDYSFIKITVINDGVSYEWEYENPNKYEFEQGEKVIKDAAAKKKMNEIVQLLKLHSDAKIEDMVQVLQNHGYNQLEKVDIRVMDHDGKLFTWIWNKNE